MSQLYPATNTAICRIPSRTTATIYNVRVLPEIGAAFCPCDSFVFSKGPHKSCFHCREALAQFEARRFVQPTAVEIAANAIIEPFEDDATLAHCPVCRAVVVSDESVCSACEAAKYAERNAETVRRLREHLAGFDSGVLEMRDYSFLAESLAKESMPV